MTPRAARRWCARCLFVGVVWCLVVTVATPDAWGQTLDPLRNELRLLDEDLEKLRLEALDLAVRSRTVADDIAELEREESLVGPVKRARYDRLRQTAEELADRQALIDSRRDQLAVSYRTAAEALLSRLDVEIDAVRDRYQSLERSSIEAAIAFQRFQDLRRERREILDRLAPSAHYVRLDLVIDPDDTPRNLETKADLLADSRDITARLLSQLTGWRDRLEEDHLMYEENQKLLEENELFRSRDPLDLPPGGGSFGAVPAITLPPALIDLAERLSIPEGGVADLAGYNGLLAEIARLAIELEDDILEMSENEQRMRAEAARRRGGE